MIYDIRRAHDKVIQLILLASCCFQNSWLNFPTPYLNSMKYFLFTFFCFVGIAATPIHKFYFSNSNLEFNANAKSTEWTIKIFYDDLELALLRQFNEKISFHQQAASAINPLLENYFSQHIGLKFDNVSQLGHFIGYELSGDLVTVYVEFPYATNFHVLEVFNDVLCKDFEDQKNVIQVSHMGRTETVLLDKKTTLSFLNY
jgi:hypothetical protein